jgi:hypothetical protein
VKLQLDASGVPGAREVTPAATRRLLKTLLERQPALQGQLGMREAGELLAFCLADTLRPAEPAPHSAAGSPAAAAAAQQAGGLGTHPQGGGARPPLDPLALPPQLLGFVDSATTNMGSIVNSLRDTLGIPVLDFSAAAGDAAAGGGGGSSVNVAAARECARLPLYTASRRFLRLGDRGAGLLLCPAGCAELLLGGGAPGAGDGPGGIAPAALAAAADELGERLLHPELSAALRQYLLVPQLRQLLGLRFLTLQACQELLQRPFAGTWRSPEPVMAAMCGAARAAQPLPWADGAAGGPTPAQLEGVWRVLHAVRREALLWGEGEQEWAPLEGWPLLPTTAGQLVPLGCRQLLFTVPRGAALSPPPPPSPLPLVFGDEPEPPPVAAPVAVPDWAQLQPPWHWLLPALQEAGCPVLDPRFSRACRELCGVALLDRLVDPTEPPPAGSLPGLITGAWLGCVCGLGGWGVEAASQAESACL